jgi:hypothetical protein
MPRVSDTVSDMVWRVWKPTSLRTCASMRCGEMSATICRICRGAATLADSMAAVIAVKILTMPASPDD